MFTGVVFGYGSQSAAIILFYGTLVIHANGGICASAVLFTSAFSTTCTAIIFAAIISITFASIIIWNLGANLKLGTFNSYEGGRVSNTELIPELMEEKERL